MIKSALGVISFILFTDTSAKQPNADVHYISADTVVTRISRRYAQASFLRRFLMGKNYRKTWDIPVKLPVFRLASSGLVIEKLGGGQQTKSLRLKDAQGIDWVLRTIDKDVSGALPKRLQGTIAQRLVQDMISASYPYAALVVGSLAKDLEIVAPMPAVYFVPDDPALGEYRSIFANTVCYLEEREPTPDNKDTDDTEKMLENLREKNSFDIIQTDLLKARLLDMLVGDWDRHSDQWRWGTRNVDGRKFYYPIPRDRDNALFYSNGVIPAFAKLTFMKHLSGFKKSSSGLKRLNGKAWLFDKTFLNELDRATWKKIIADFQHGLPDAVIEKAVRLLPPEVFARDGALIIDKLKKRRDGLMEHALDYYEFISEQVTVKGSNEEEIFVATTDPAKNLVITMYRGKNGERQKKLYERRFPAGETHILHLEGFDGNDYFLTDQQAASRTRIRFFGGNGADTYSLKGDIRSEVIDTTSEKNIVLDSRSAKIRFQ